MCRSKAEGGRRCTGHAAKPAGASGADRAASGRVTPSRADVDRMAARIPSDRTDFTGRRLSTPDRRLYALRESGYTGPIDQDGYPDTTSDSAQILRTMARQRGEHVTW